MKKENEANAAGSRIKDEEVAKHTIKDSVFTNLFQDKKYLLQLYKTLHPEDTQVSEDALSDITIHNIMTNDVYNDVGFMVGEKLLILTEAQTTWTENIAVRILIYLMVTYQDYIKKTKQNAYRSKKIKLPRPELYVIYTGDRKERTEYISLADEFFEGQKTFLDAKIKVLYGSGQGDIISQYVTFTKVVDEQRKLYGMTEQTVRETIRICKDRNVLKEYLMNREMEVVTIMMSLFNDEQIMKTYLKDMENTLTDKITHDKDREIAERLIKKGKMSLEDIADCVPALSFDELKEIENEVMQLA